MAQQLVELCSILIEDTYGELAAYIWSTLAKHGRSTFMDIVSKSHLPMHHLESTLPVLISHNLVVHHTDTDYDTTYYSVEWSGAYSLVRTGRVGNVVAQRCGKHAAQVVENVAQLGHVRICDLGEAYELMPSSKRDSGVSPKNADSDDEEERHFVLGSGLHKDAIPITSVAHLHGVLRKLLRAGFLVKTHPRMFRSQHDLYKELEERVISEGFPDRKVTGPKKQEEFNRAVRDLKRKLRDEEDFCDSRPAGFQGAVQRPDENPAKRQKVNGHVPNGACDDGEIAHAERLPNELTVRVNLSKCLLVMRTQRYVRVAAHYLGDATGAVYEALLKTLESQVREVRDDLDSVHKDHDHQEDDDEDEEEDDEEEDTEQLRSTVTDISNALDPEVDLSSGIKVSLKGLPNGVGKHRKKAEPVEDDDDDFTGIGIKQEQASDDDELDGDGLASLRVLNGRHDMIEKHLLLLQEHPRAFCRRIGSGSSAEWTVNFPAITSSIIATEIDSTISARFGKVATRLVRLLREKGKLEEKQVATYALMRAKDVRVVLGELHANGFVESQELPKDNSRQPSRTLFLWYVDQKKAQQMLLHQSYQAMSRAFQRLTFERQRYKEVIRKAERFVEDELLGRDDGKSFIIGETGALEEKTPLRNIERQHLQEWRDIEEKFLCQVVRLDDMVALLRDFGGKDSSMRT